MDAELTFTGEYFVPGQSGDRIERDHLERYRFAAQYADGRRVMDIACGTGYAAPIMLEAGARSYLGVDVNEALVAHATSRYGSSSAEFVNGDVRTFGETSSVDLITCFETIEHVTDYQLALKNLRRVLAPGGELLISTPNRTVTSPDARSLGDAPRNRFHAQEFTALELTGALREAGFRVRAEDVFGQRFRVHFRAPLANKIARRLLGNPDERTSPVVRRLSLMTPRYVVLAAHK